MDESKDMGTVSTGCYLRSYDKEEQMRSGKNFFRIEENGDVYILMEVTNELEEIGHKGIAGEMRFLVEVPVNRSQGKR